MAPLRYAAKFDPFLSLDCAGVEGGGRNPIKSKFCHLATLYLATMNTSIILCLAAALSLSSIAVAILPNGECTADNQSCELESNNVIGIINGVASVDECLDQGTNSIGWSSCLKNILRYLFDSVNSATYQNYRVIQ